MEFIPMEGEQMSEKEYPTDYTKEEIELIKKIVIARLETLPSNFRMAIG